MKVLILLSFQFYFAPYDTVAPIRPKRIKERQEDGIKAALSKGIKFGRKRIEVDENFKYIYNEWKEKKIKGVDAMKKVGLKSNTFYRRVKEYEQI